MKFMVTIEDIMAQRVMLGGGKICMKYQARITTDDSQILDLGKLPADEQVEIEIKENLISPA